MPASENTKEELKKFVESHAIASLSTVSPDNIPYTAIVYVVLDDELNFYFITRNGSRKIEYLGHNNNASLAIYDQSKPYTIQAQGNVHKVENPDTFINLFVKIAESSAKETGGFHWPPPVTKIDNNMDISMFKFVPNWLRLGDFSGTEHAMESPDHIFKQIIP